MQRQVTNWEKTFIKRTSDKGLFSKIYKEVLKLNNEKTNNLIHYKMGQSSDQTPHEDERVSNICHRELQVKAMIHTYENGQNPESADTSKCRGGCGATGALIRYWQEGEMVQPLGRVW